MGYADRTRRPPKTLTAAEQQRVLRASGEHRDGFRDHVIISLALGTGLRESEVVGLDVEDVLNPSGGVRRALQLRVFKRGGGKADPEAQRVTLPDCTFYKLEKYVRSLGRKTGPLFASRMHGGGRRRGLEAPAPVVRLSVRRVRGLWRHWQKVARFDHLYSFHQLRHTAVTNAYEEAGGDMKVAQRFARHAKIETTAIYAHPSDERMARVTKKLAS